MTPSSSSRRSRAVRMSRGAPVLAAMSLNRRTPRNSSRTTSSDHFSPTTSRAPAIEHRRGVVVRVSVVTPAAWHKEFANPTDLGYGPRSTAGWKYQPTHNPLKEDHVTVLEQKTSPGITEPAAYKLARLAAHYDGIDF